MANKIPPAPRAAAPASTTLDLYSYFTPFLPDGDYTLQVGQTVNAAAGAAKPFAPSTTLNFSVCGPRFTLDPALIQSQYPPPKSTGAFYNVLPHIILDRSTLPWERSIDHGATADTPWLALLLFDTAVDGPPPTPTPVTVQDLLNTYGTVYNPPGQPEFVQMCASEPSPPPSTPYIALENGQHPTDQLSVIDVPKTLLQAIMPFKDDLQWTAHVRVGAAVGDPTVQADYPVVFCNRVPAPGTANAAAPNTGSTSTVHLVSLESREQLLHDLQYNPAPAPTDMVRLISLASWSFSTLFGSSSFEGLLVDAWCPGATQSGTAYTCTTGQNGHMLTLPLSGNVTADAMLPQGFVPMRHRTRQGNNIVSWHRGPLVPGMLAADPTIALPVLDPDMLMRYLSDQGMFDTTYASAWELGKLLMLRNKAASTDLCDWKREMTRQVQMPAVAAHLPFRLSVTPPPFPASVTDFLADLALLNHVPFHYLVPDERMLPAVADGVVPPGSIRFFEVDRNWIDCILDGAFSVGRATSLDATNDASWRSNLPTVTPCSGFILRSPMVSGWPHLGVEAYPTGSDPNTATPQPCLRMDRLAPDILFCLFSTVPPGSPTPVKLDFYIHEHPDTMHFGLDLGADPKTGSTDPNDLNVYFKNLRDATGKENGPSITNTEMIGYWRSPAQRVLSMAPLAAEVGNKETIANLSSAQFAVTMLEGAARVGFLAT